MGGLEFSPTLFIKEGFNKVFFGKIPKIENRQLKMIYFYVQKESMDGYTLSMHI